jgi:predicted patatin/cPLA2 family phospholipase
MSNSGVVTDTAVQLDQNKLRKYVSGRNALVAQGGGQRGIFTSGVLDAFLLSNFDPFDAFYGTSAGALNLCGFLCRQRGIGRSFILELTTQPEFFHLFSYIRRKRYLGLDWALEKICDYPYRLDIDMGRQVLGSRQAYAAVTNTADLRDRYLPMLKSEWRKVMVATCAIPRLYHQAIHIGDEEFVDGGVSASIPVQEAWRQSARFIAVIRTEGADLEEPLVDSEIESKHEWLQEPLNLLQGQWQQKLGQLKNEWQSFLGEQLHRSKLNPGGSHLEALNGGRWLFGADDVYRLSHLLGDKFDSGLADMLMVHYQTYSLTQDFLNSPPDDCFIVQIRPNEPLRSSSLMSEKEDLLHDYELGLQAGYHFVEQYSFVSKRALFPVK